MLYSFSLSKVIQIKLRFKVEEGLNELVDESNRGKIDHLDIKKITTLRK